MIIPITEMLNAKATEKNAPTILRNSIYNASFKSYEKLISSAVLLIFISV
jgi:hypothetical protein